MVYQLKKMDAQLLNQQDRVSPEEFTKLIVSRTPLIRRDDPENMLRGLVDQSGRWFVVLESELIADRTPPRDDNC